MKEKHLARIKIIQKFKEAGFKMMYNFKTFKKVYNLLENNIKPLWWYYYTAKDYKEILNKNYKEIF